MALTHWVVTFCLATKHCVAFTNYFIFMLIMFQESRSLLMLLLITSDATLVSSTLPGTFHFPSRFKRSRPPKMRQDGHAGLEFAKTIRMITCNARGLKATFNTLLLTRQFREIQRFQKSCIFTQPFHYDNHICVT